MATNIPASIGPFRVESLLGVGGMGQVYKAVDPTLGRTVAVKVLKSDDSESTFFKRLLREAQAYGRLTHPNIVTVYEAREAAGGLYIAMEYLEGSSLSAVLNRDELGLEARVGLLIQILDALQYAHAQGIVHRDIKPSNIHILADGTVKLLDFGLARVMRAETLTATDVVIGTPHYASPEQLMGQEIDGRTDVYSTGVVAFEMLTRRRPFDGHSLGSLVAKVLSEPAPPMDTPWSRAFPDIERIVRRAMAKQVHERYPSAAEMGDALKAFLAAAQPVLANGRDATVKMREIWEAKTVRLPATPDVRTATEPVPAPTRPAVPAPTQNAPAPDAPRPRIPDPPPLPARRGRTLAMWLGAITVLAGVSIVSLTLGTQRAGNRGPSEQAAAPSAEHRTEGGAAQPGSAGARKGAGMPPSNDPPGPGSPRVSGKGGDVRDRGQQPPADGRTQVAVEPRSVFIEPGSDASLNRELLSTLTDKGVKTVATAGRTSLSVNVRIDISIRPAPFGGTSALTADFVATLQMRDARGLRTSRSISGHALDFGEAVVKQAAHKRAAEQLAEIITAALRE